MMKNINIIFLMIFGLHLSAQNVLIKGKAHPSHIGKVINLFDFSDYITYSRTIESTDTIDKDGYFELKIESKITKPLLINVNNLTGKLYVQPNFVYGIYFPGEDSLTNHQLGTETTVDITVYGKDSLELNALIIDFNTQYNNLFSKSNEVYLSPSKINFLLDSFVVACKARYSSISSPYFKNYINYSFADFFSNTSRNKLLLYKQFLENKPVLFSNYEYMQFFNSYYKGYLKAYASTKNGGSIYNSINNFADLNDLKKQFQFDKSINNDTIRELVILKGLIDFYYSPDFDKKQVQSVIEQLYHETSIYYIKNIAHNFLQTIYLLQPGANAPDFIAEDKSGAVVNLYNYLNGKYLYLNFFSTSSETSIKEMQKIIDLKKKFNHKVTFVSVCLDDSIKTFRNYLKSNPKQDWIILYQTKHSTAKQKYNIKTLSGFFFMNAQKQLVQSPAPSPSDGIEYKFNALFRPKKKNTIPGIR